MIGPMNLSLTVLFSCEFDKGGVFDPGIEAGALVFGDIRHFFGVKKCTFFTKTTKISDIDRIGTIFCWDLRSWMDHGAGRNWWGADGTGPLDETTSTGSMISGRWGRAVARIVLFSAGWRGDSAFRIGAMVMVGWRRGMFPRNGVAGVEIAGGETCGAKEV